MVQKRNDSMRQNNMIVLEKTSARLKPANFRRAAPAGAGNDAVSIPSRETAADEAEFASITGRPGRVNKFSITAKDTVLIAISMSENAWLETVEACIYAGANFVFSDPALEALFLAETIVREEISVLATTPQVWLLIYRHLNVMNPGKIRNLRVIEI